MNEPQDGKLIRIDGKVEDYPPANGQTYTLEELQKAAGGYIELVHLRYGRTKYQMVVNEEGAGGYIELVHLRYGRTKYQMVVNVHLPINLMATALAHLYGDGKYNRDVIVGDVLVVSDRRIA